MVRESDACVCPSLCCMLHTDVVVDAQLLAHGQRPTGKVVNTETFVADVAELADALDSKSSTRKSVWVRPPPSAPLK